MPTLEKYMGCCTTKILYGLEGLDAAGVKALKANLRPTVSTNAWSHFSTVQCTTTQKQEVRCKTLRSSLESLGFKLVHTSKKWKDGGYVEEGGLNTYIADAREFAAAIIGDENDEYEARLKTKVSELQMRARLNVMIPAPSGYPKAISTFRNMAELKTTLLNTLAKNYKFKTLRQAFGHYEIALGASTGGMNLMYDPVTVRNLGGFKTSTQLSEITPANCPWFTNEYVADRFIAWLNGEFK